MLPYVYSLSFHVIRNSKGTSSNTAQKIKYASAVKRLLKYQPYSIEDYIVLFSVVLFSVVLFSQSVLGNSRLLIFDTLDCHRAICIY